MLRGSSILATPSLVPFVPMSAAVPMTTTAAYGAPTMTYGATYAAPAMSYAAPTMSYAAPTMSAAAPTMSYGSYVRCLDFLIGIARRLSCWVWYVHTHIWLAAES